MLAIAVSLGAMCVRICGASSGRGGSPEEAIRHVLLRVKVPSRVEGVGWSGAGAVIAVVGDGADVPQRPARLLGRARDVRRVGAQEVDLIERARVARAGQDDEEEKDACAGGQDERDEGEGGSCGGACGQSRRCSPPPPPPPPPPPKTMRVCGCGIKRALTGRHRVAWAG